MMRKIIYTIVTVFLLTQFASCDLDTKPSDQVNLDNLYTDIESMDKDLTGTWYYMMETFSTYANPGFGTFLRTGDAMGSDVVINTRYGYRDTYPFTAIYNKTNPNNFAWTLGYKVVNNTNLILRGIEEVSGDATTKARVKAQALALRGYMYLFFASHYSFAIDKDPDAVNVPIYTEKDTALEVKPAASVSEVYAQAISDLEDALETLPTSYTTTDKWRFNKLSITSLLARANLYTRHWDKAADYATKALAINSYLMSENEYREGFNSVLNNEWILGQPSSEEQTNASYQFNYLDVTSSDSYYFSFNADPYFKDLFADTDYRKSMINWAPDPNLDDADAKIVWMRYAKFKFKTGKLADIVLMRTSELYLINAEANAQLGNTNVALENLNKLEQARNATITSGVSGQQLLDAIWLERRKELFGEGFSLVDIIRNQQSVVRKSYPTTEIQYTYEESAGVTKSISVIPQGHRIVSFPDGTSFTNNSKYYLFRIPDAEETYNSIIYQDHPILDIYK